MVDREVDVGRPMVFRDLLDEVIATLLMTHAARVYPHALTGSSAPNPRLPLAIGAGPQAADRVLVGFVHGNHQHLDR